MGITYMNCDICDEPGDEYCFGRAKTPSGRYTMCFHCLTRLTERNGGIGYRWESIDGANALVGVTVFVDDDEVSLIASSRRVIPPEEYADHPLRDQASHDRFELFFPNDIIEVRTTQIVRLEMPVAVWQAIEPQVAEWRSEIKVTEVTARVHL